MSRWMMSLVGGLALLFLLMAAFSGGTVQAQSAGTAAVGSTAIAPAGSMIGSVTPELWPHNPPYPYPPNGIVLTIQDNGRTFYIGVGTEIALNIPHTPFTRLVYDPTILRPIPPRPAPLPPDVNLPVPYSTAQSGPISTPVLSGPASTPETQSDSTTVPQTGPSVMLPYFPWRLIALRPGTTPLRLESIPCPPGQVCPMMPVIAFHVTIVVQDYDYFTPVAPAPPFPPVYGNPDVYIGTAYLDQTVRVRPGQLIAVDPAFLAPTEPIVLDYDPAVLRPLPGQDLQHPQARGWLFNVVGPGSTLLTVRTSRCLNGQSDTPCTPSPLFRVTITAGNGQ